MGKIPTIAIVAIVAVLIIGISAAAFYLLIKPEQAKLTELNTRLDEEKKVAGQLDKATGDLEKATADWLEAQTQLADLQERKSIHISMYMPIMAMTALWYEYRQDLPGAVEDFIKSTGCTIVNGAAMPAPSMAPPTVPSNGFLQVPEGAPINLTVEGTLADIERLYKSLSDLRRIGVIGSLSLTGTGEILRAQIPLTLYIMVEGAEAAAPPPAAGGGGGGPDDMMMMGGPDGPGGGPPGGPDGGAPPPGPPDGGGGGGGDD